MELRTQQVDIESEEEGRWFIFSREGEEVFEVKLRSNASKAYVELYNALRKPHLKTLTNPVSREAAGKIEEEILTKAISTEIIRDWRVRNQRTGRLTPPQLEGKPWMFSAERAKEVLTDPAWRLLANWIVDTYRDASLFRCEYDPVDEVEAVGKSESGPDGDAD